MGLKERHSQPYMTCSLGNFRNTISLAGAPYITANDTILGNMQNLRRPVSIRLRAAVGTAVFNGEANTYNFAATASRSMTSAPRTQT